MVEKMIRTTSRTTFSANLGSRRVDVSGFKVTIPGFEDFSFVVHRPVIDVDGTQAKELWQVSELSSGQIVSGHQESTRQQAIDNAAKLLNHVGRTALESAIESALR